MEFLLESFVPTDENQSQYDRYLDTRSRFSQQVIDYKKIEYKEKQLQDLTFEEFQQLQKEEFQRLQLIQASIMKQVTTKRIKTMEYQRLVKERQSQKLAEDDTEIQNIKMMMERRKTTASWKDQLKNELKNDQKKHEQRLQLDTNIEEQVEKMQNLQNFIKQQDRKPIVKKHMSTQYDLPQEQMDLIKLQQEEQKRKKEEQQDYMTKLKNDNASLVEQIQKFYYNNEFLEQKILKQEKMFVDNEFEQERKLKDVISELRIKNTTLEKIYSTKAQQTVKIKQQSSEFKQQMQEKKQQYQMQRGTYDKLKTRKSELQQKFNKLQAEAQKLDMKVIMKKNNVENNKVDGSDDNSKGKFFIKDSYSSQQLKEFQESQKKQSAREIEQKDKSTGKWSIGRRSSKLDRLSTNIPDKDQFTSSASQRSGFTTQRLGRESSDMRLNQFQSSQSQQFFSQKYNSQQNKNNIINNRLGSFSQVQLEQKKKTLSNIQSRIKIKTIDDYDQLESYFKDWGMTEFLLLKSFEFNFRHEYIKLGLTTFNELQEENKDVIKEQHQIQEQIQKNKTNQNKSFDQKKGEKDVSQSKSFKLVQIHLMQQFQINFKKIAENISKIHKKQKTQVKQRVEMRINKNCVKRLPILQQNIYSIL